MTINKNETIAMLGILICILTLASLIFNEAHSNGVTHGRLKQCERTIGCNMEALKAELYDEMNGETK